MHKPPLSPAKAPFLHPRVAGFPRIALMLALIFSPGLAHEAIASCKKSPKAGKSAEQHQIGKASWYGPGFHGKKTASGQPFNQHAYTAAHPRLPLGSRARVTNLANGKEVEVTINDRGPHRGGRIIDLSHAAARQLAMGGSARVKVETLTD